MVTRISLVPVPFHFIRLEAFRYLGHILSVLLKLPLTFGQGYIYILEYSYLNEHLPGLIS